LNPNIITKQTLFFTTPGIIQGCGFIRRINQVNGYTVFRNTVIVLGTLALAYLLFATLNVWIVLIVAILIASAFRPLIMRLRRWRLPEAVAILIVYGLFTLGTILLFVSVLPPVVNQFVSYIQNEDRLANRIIIAQFWVNRTISQATGTDVGISIPEDDIRRSVRDLVETIRVTAPNLVTDASNLLSNVILIIVMGVYWITSRQKAEDFIVELMPPKRQPQARAILQEVEFGLGAYVRGVATISMIVGTLCFIALLLLRVPNAATLAFIYALSTAVPIIGGLVGVVVCTVLALLSSPTLALFVLIVTVALQQFENYYLAPRIVSQNTVFDEILVIVFIAAGFSLGGITGALIAIPVAGTAAILLKHLVLEPRRSKIIPQRVDGGIRLEPVIPVELPPEPGTPLE
jgi:putative heme transporter